MTSKVRRIPELKLKVNSAQDSELHGAGAGAVASAGYKANVNWRFKQSVRVDGDSQVEPAESGLQASHAALSRGVSETDSLVGGLHFIQ
jgi:hypothetical protein